MKVYHSRTQHPVGQGGFHSAVVDDGNGEFRYIYDCGSTNTEALVACITDFCDQVKDVDLLFLSHLDQDHVNGLDKLLTEISATTVVLPYLSPFERLVLVAEALARPVGTNGVVTVIELLASPERWFVERGVKRVVFVTPTRNADQMQIDIQSIGEPGLDFPTQTEKTTVKPRESGAPKYDVAKIASGPIVLSGQTGAALWVLIPFVHPEEQCRLRAFRLAAAKLMRIRKRHVDSSRWIAKLKSVIRDPELRRELARLYNKHVRKDRNLSSMSLYSGPPSGEKKADNGWPRMRRLPGRPGTKATAWLGTGDMHLDVRKRLDAFADFYKQQLPGVNTITLPHHGSPRNLRSSFVQDLGDHIWVAAYGTDNTYGHPGRHLAEVADTYGRLEEVTERSRSFVERGTYEWIG